MSTVERWRSVANRIEVRSLPWKLRIEIIEAFSGDAIQIRITGRAPERDTLEQVSIHFVNVTDGSAARVSDDAIVREIYDRLRKVVMHELDEAFTLDGTRIYDPHMGER